MGHGSFDRSAIPLSWWRHRNEIDAQDARVTLQCLPESDVNDPRVRLHALLWALLYFHF